MQETEAVQHLQQHGLAHFHDHYTIQNLQAGTHLAGTYLRTGALWQSQVLSPTFPLQWISKKTTEFCC